MARAPSRPSSSSRAQAARSSASASRARSIAATRRLRPPAPPRGAGWPGSRWSGGSGSRPRSAGRRATRRGPGSRGGAPPGRRSTCRSRPGHPRGWRQRPDPMARGDGSSSTSGRYDGYGHDHARRRPRRDDPVPAQTPPPPATSSFIPCSTSSRRSDSCRCPRVTTKRPTTLALPSCELHPLPPLVDELGQFLGQRHRHTDGSEHAHVQGPPQGSPLDTVAAPRRVLRHNPGRACSSCRPAGSGA